MQQSPDDFIVTAPAFVTLFGEHHRHLGFGSIVMATSLRMAIRATARDDGLVFVGGFGGEGVCFNPGETPDFPETEIIPGACLSHLSFDVHPGHGYSFRALNTQGLSEADWTFDTLRPLVGRLQFSGHLTRA